MSLPPGFVLDQPNEVDNGPKPPPGFVLDSNSGIQKLNQTPEQPGFARQVLTSAMGMPGQIAQGGEQILTQPSKSIGVRYTAQIDPLTGATEVVPVPVPPIFPAGKPVVPTSVFQNSLNLQPYKGPMPFTHVPFKPPFGEVGAGVSEKLSQFTTPENIKLGANIALTEGGLPQAARQIVNRALALYFGSKLATEDLPEAAGRFSAQPTQKGIGEVIGSTLGAAGAFYGARDFTKPEPEPVAEDTRTPLDRYEGYPERGPERQLPQYGEKTVRRQQALAEQQKAAKGGEGGATEIPFPFITKEGGQGPVSGAIQRLHSGTPIDPDDLRPAVEILGKTYVGKVGQTHADIFKEHGADPEAPGNTHYDKSRFFWAKGQKLDRQQAAQILGKTGTADAGGADSMDLPNAGKLAMLRKVGMSEEEITGAKGKLYSGLPYDEKGFRKFPKGFMGGGYWIDSDGKMIPAEPAHLEAGAKIAGLKKGKDEDLDDFHSRVWDTMHDLGYARLREDLQGNIYIASEASKLQRAVIEKYAIENEKTLKDDFGKILYEPPKSGEQNLYSGIPIPDREKELRGPFALTSSRILMTPSQSGFTKTDQAYDATQVWNRLANKAPKAEIEVLKSLGIDEEIKSKEKITTEEAARIVQEKGPRVEVRKLEATKTVTPEQQEYSQLQHWWDSLADSDQKAMKVVFDRGQPLTKYDAPLFGHPLNENWIRDVNRYHELARKSIAENWRGQMKNESATARYTMVNPKPLDQMPGAVDILVRVPTELPTEFRKGVNEIEIPKYRSPHYPTEGKNLLAHMRGYMETLPNGEKVFHVFEVQSDWAQQVRDIRGSRPGGQDFFTPEERAAKIDDPLLRHYERLAIKAAIDHARKEGATAIAISDAETAMMTEGHDRNLVDRGDDRSTQSKNDAGMRLHYDRTLPGITEELTGAKGEMVDFGEHQNAYQNSWRDETGSSPGVPRPDLIFRNPDGSPKTSITARMYSLKDVGGPGPEGSAFSLFEKDRPSARGTYLYSGIPLPESLKRIWDSLDADRLTLFTAFSKGARQIKDLVSAKRDAVDNAPLLTSEKAMSMLNLDAEETFGKGKNADLARAAAVVVQEAKGDQSRLAKFRAQAQKANYKEGVAAIDFAQKNWARLQPMVRHAEAIDDMNLRMAKNADISVPQRDYYVKRSYEDDPRGVFFRERPQAGVGRASLLPRKYDTLFDAVEAGLKPMQLDISQAVGKRTRELQQDINLHLWTEGFKKTEFRGQPVIQEMPKPIRGVSIPPEGYSKVEVGPGRTVAVLKPFAHVFKAVSSESHISGSLPGQALLELVGGVKHGTLAFDSFHLSRIYQFYKSLNFTGDYRHGLSLLEYSAKDIDRAIALGHLPESARDYLNEVVDTPQGKFSRKEVNSIGVRNGLNIGKHSEGLYSSFVRTFPGFRETLGKFNQFVFDKVSRGAIADAFQAEFERVANNNPSWTTDKVGRSVARDINFRLGNIGRQGIFKSRTMQDLMQIAFLAPRWVESMAQSEVRSIAQAPGAIATGKVPTLMKSTMGILGAYIVGAQVINMLSTGHPTWDNDKDHQLDAYIPSLKKGGKGFWLSPLSVAAELTHDIIRYNRGETGSPGVRAVKVGARIIENKFSPVARAIDTAVSGGPMDRENPSIGAGLEELVNPTPLPLRQAKQSIKQKDFVPIERQGMATIGLKAEPESGAEQRARETKGMSLKERGQYEEQQRVTLKERDKNLSQAEKEAGQLRAEMSASKANKQRGDQVMSTLSKADKSWLESRDMKVTGIADEVRYQGKRIKLTKDETEKLLGYTQEEITKWAMPLLRRRYEFIPEQNQSRFASDIMADAKNRARQRLLKELDSKIESNRKRFSAFNPNQ